MGLSVGWPHVSSLGKTMKSVLAENHYHERIMEILNESDIPMDVENVRLKAGLKNWESTKAMLLELVLQGRIEGQKTTKSWIFWIRGETADTKFGSRRFLKRPVGTLPSGEAPLISRVGGEKK